jgi:hypothetical protein
MARLTLVEFRRGLPPLSFFMSFSFFPSKQVEDVNTIQTTTQMPNVFVVPPEEDQTPPWCFFDAENPALSQVVERPETPEIAVLDLSYDDDIPIYRRNPHPDSVVPTPKGIETVSVVQALLRGNADDDDADDSDSEFEQDMVLEDNSRVTHDSHRQESARTFRDVADDSDVIEVVRLNRKDYSSEDPEEIRSIQSASERKRTTTLKYRASKVFRSLRGSLRSSKPPVQDVFKSPPSISSSQSTDTHSRTRTPTMSRRGTLILSQLFTSPSPSLKSRNSMTSFDEPISSPTEVSLSPLLPPQSKPVTEVISRRSSLYAAEAQDEARLRASSPTPTTTSTKSSIRRFSIMNLQRLFSFSSSAPSSASQTDASVPFDDSGRATPTPRSNAPTPRSSVTTTSGPQTPTSSEGISSAYILSTQDASDLPAFMGFDSAFDANVGVNLGLGLGLDLDSSSYSQQATPRKKLLSDSLWRSKASKKAKPASRNARDEAGDDSLEMRLDSFHFDDLSFDADEFQAT